jgi:glutamyl-tRNA(Gln) amidotransferase subunit D
MAEPGDKILIQLENEQIKGVLMPRPGIFQGGYLVLKLENGYNIGIREDSIKSIEVLEKYQKIHSPEPTPKKNEKLPTIALLTAGGTIASRVDYRTGAVSAGYSGEDFLTLIPELRKVANVKSKAIMNIMSEDMNALHWKKLASAVLEELQNPEIAGVVISHGTDTMHFTSAALSFFLHNINKPVIITGAQRSIDRGSSDAFLNFYCSITAAAHWDGAEVAICMHTTANDTSCDLHRGTKVRKMHTSRRDAFQTINDIPLARITDKGAIKILNPTYQKRETRKPELRDTFDERVALITSYPGMDPRILQTPIDLGFKGIVIVGTGLGHVATDGKLSLLPTIEVARKKGISVVITSQTLYGRTHPLVYTNLRKLSVERGCIFASDMLPEVAYIKLGWLIGQGLNEAEIAKKMLENVASEINNRHELELF